MNTQSVYRDLALLMAGVGSIIAVGTIVSIYASDPADPAIGDLPTSTVMRTLVDTEFKHLIVEGLVAQNSSIAIGPELSEVAADAVKNLDFRWTRETSWPGNRGVPPPGTVLVRELRIDEDHGVVSVVVGEAAASLSCGITVNSRYVWRGGWTERNGSRRMC